MESVFGSNMDMEQYLAQQALKIQDLRDRKLFKDVMDNLLLAVYGYTQQEYQALEQRVFGELQTTQSDYTIYMGLTDRAHYDATDPFLHPMRQKDTDAPCYNVAELLEALKEKRPYPLYTVFLEADCETAQRFGAEGHLYEGTVRTERGEHRATCAVRLSHHYLDMVAELYQVFCANYRPWSTVCTAYLHKLFDVELLEVESLDAKETIREIQVNFEGFQPQIRYDCIPLWNLAPVIEKTSSYPEPCIDSLHYDHRIFAHRLDPACQYMVADAQVELTNIRRSNGDLILTSPQREPYQWRLYRVDRPHGQSRTPYPVLSNLGRETFSGSLAEMYRRGVKTKAEISRVLASFDYGEYVAFQDVLVEPISNAKGQTYSMDDFLLDELRTGDGRSSMVLTFTSPQPGHYLTLDIMSFLVSQIQRLFPEYLCCGRLV